MKLSKVKKVCTDAGQMCVVNTTGAGNNLVQQWVGTQDALYPLRDVMVTEGMLKMLWELSPVQIAAMEEAPVKHDEEFLRELDGQIDTDSAEPICLCTVMGMWAMKCGDGVVFVDPDMLKPCGEWRNYVIVRDDEGPWVAVYHQGVLDGLVRPVKDDRAEALLAAARVAAQREIVRWRKK